jgi:hypothetical protein
MTPTDRSYAIDPRPAELGGGWRLKLMINGKEHGGGVFPPGGWADAMSESKSWVSHAEGKDDGPAGP